METQTAHTVPSYYKTLFYKEDEVKPFLGVVLWGGLMCALGCSGVTDLGQSNEVTMRFRIVLPDSTDTPQGMSVHVSWDGGTAEAQVGPDGNATITGAIPSVLVESVISGDSRYFPDTIRTHRTLDNKLVVLPRTWTVKKGIYAGQVLPVLRDDLFKAAGPDDPLSFFREVPGTAFIPGWPESAFPLTIYFDRSGSDFDLTDTKQQMVLAAVNEVDRVTGRNLLEWGTSGKLKLTLHQISSLDGQATITWDSSTGNITSGGIEIDDQREFTALSGPQAAINGLISHEFWHVLGFGHTCSWRTTMTSIDCIASVDDLTPMDVAMFELAYSMRDRSVATGASYSSALPLP